MSYCFYALKCLKDLPRERMHVIYDFPIYFGFKYLNLLITGRNRQLWFLKNLRICQCGDSEPQIIIDQFMSWLYRLKILPFRTILDRFGYTGIFYYLLMSRLSLYQSPCQKKQGRAGFLLSTFPGLLLEKSGQQQPNSLPQRDGCTSPSRGAGEDIDILLI